VRAVAALAALVSLALGVPASADGGPSTDATAEAAFSSGHFDAAAEIFAQVLKTQATDATANLGLGTIRLYQNDLTAARPLLAAAIAADPSDTHAQARMRELERRVAEAKQVATVAGTEADVPFVIADPLPVVRIRIDGTEANFMVDTGGSFVVEPDFAQRLGLSVQSAGNGVFAGGKQAAMSTSVVKSVDAGGAHAENVPAIVMPTHATDLFASGTKIDGVIGTTLFERFLVTIDYPHARLILRPRSATASATFQTAAQSAGATIVPCWLAGDHFVLANARVNDAPPGLFLFDSGLAGGGISPSKELLDAAHITLDTKSAFTGVGGGGPVAAVPFVAHEVAVDTAVQRDVRGLYTPEGDPLETLFPFKVWGLISNDYLKHYAYTVDFDAMKIVLAPGA
jgi:hypothetical protein